jgi:omega-6 fatty acid desaturase (delta-12 desaturase)
MTGRANAVVADQAAKSGLPDATGAAGGRGDAAWLALLAPYRTLDRRRSAFELGITIMPFILLWVSTWAAVMHGWWIGLLLTVPAAGFLVRLFMIQHDCGHGSFFGRRRVDEWTGRLLGVLTLTPYDH